MKGIEIREAVENDSAQILTFIKELASYEKAIDEVVAEEKDIRESVFGSNSGVNALICTCLLYTSPSPRDGLLSRMPSSA